MNIKENSQALKLQKRAIDLGASDAKIISVDGIPVEDEVVDFQNRCFSTHPRFRRSV
jgi:hypothetical protein